MLWESCARRSLRAVRESVVPSPRAHRKNATQTCLHLPFGALELEIPHDYVGNCRRRNQRIFQVEIEIAGNSAAQLRVTIFPALPEPGWGQRQVGTPGPINIASHRN